MTGTRKRGSGKKGGEDGQVSYNKGKSKSSSDIASQVTGEGGSSLEPAAKKSKSSSSKNKEPGQTLVKITIEHCTS